MSGISREKRHSKKSAFSCETCRQRKVKCDAGHPTCNRCRLRGDLCSYKLSPTLSYTQRLEQRVSQLEAELAEATGVANDSPCTHRAGEEIAVSGAQSRPSVSQGVQVSHRGSSRRLSFQETLSLFQPHSNARANAVEPIRADEETAAKKESLMNSAWRERAFERLADTPEPFRFLLDSHFCWIQPLFNFVYRPAFTRDMKTGGPYFSKALFNAVLSHSVRWCRDEPGMEHLLAPFDNGAAFSEMATQCLFEDIRRGQNTVPTVQALLLLSAQECGRGNRTQAWLYSGMAFRLIDDLGICVDGRRYEDADKLSTEDIEIRNRLFWSCYFWDKLISLYFGRSPIVQNSEISPPRVLMDDTAEIETWTPHGLLSPNYSPKQAHTVSCFIQMCALAEILNQILRHIYNPFQDLVASQAYQCVLAEGSKLREWWRDLPSHLKVDLSDSKLDCPPSHIVTLNCFYHTVNILLHRAKLKLSRQPELATLVAEQRPLIHCISSASAIVALFDLFVSAFGDGHVVLCLAYSLYTASSIFLLEVRATGHATPSTTERLLFCAGALERLKRTNPVIAKPFNLILRELDALGLQTQYTVSAAPPADQQRLSNQQSLPLPTEILHTSTFGNWQPQELSDQPEDAILLDLSYLSNQAEGSMSYNLLDMPPEVYEAFSQIEPISVTMNPGPDIY